MAGSTNSQLKPVHSLCQTGCQQNDLYAAMCNGEISRNCRGAGGNEETQDRGDVVHSFQY